MAGLTKIRDLPASTSQVAGMKSLTPWPGTQNLLAVTLSSFLMTSIFVTLVDLSLEYKLA